MADIEQDAQRLSEAGLLEAGEELLAFLDQGRDTGRPRGIALTGDRLFSFAESGILKEVRFGDVRSAECKAKARRTARYEFETGANGPVSILLSGGPDTLGPFCEELDRVCAGRFEGFRPLPAPPKVEKKPEPEKPKPAPSEPEHATEPETRAEEGSVRPDTSRPRAPRPAPSPYDYNTVRVFSAPSPIAVIALLLGLAGLVPRYGVPFAIAGAGLALYNRFRADTRDSDWDPSLETLTLVFAFLGIVSLFVYGAAMGQEGVRGRSIDAIWPLFYANPLRDNKYAPAIVGIVSLLLSVSFHEAAHALVSYWNGDPTAARLGRVTLNPVPHIDPFGSILLPALLFLSSGGSAFFAYAKPVPVNPNRYRNLRFGYSSVSFAGPGTNFLLAIAGMWLLFLLVSLLIILHRATGSTVLIHPQVAMTAVYSIEMFVLINVFLGVFNLLPIPPLDGYHLLEGILPYKWTDLFRPIERYGFFILFILLMTGGLSGVFRVVGKLGLDLMDFLVTSPFGL